MSVERRTNARRLEDHPKPIYKSRTILCASIGVLASGAALLGFPVSCLDQAEIPYIITMLSSFGALFFRLLAKRPIE